MTLKDIQLRTEHLVPGIESDDEEPDAFLFSLSCYAGDPITMASPLKGSCVVSFEATHIAAAVSIVPRIYALDRGFFLEKP